MPRGGPIDAAKLIPAALSVSAGPRPVRELLVEIIVNQGWYSSLDAEDKADAWLPRFKSRMRHDITTIRDEGGFLSFQFNSSGDDYVQGSCFCEPHDPLEVQQAKIRRAYTLQVHNCCLGLTPNQFEQLSGKLLSLLNVEHAYVSRRSADQGIDFFGRVPIGKMLKPTLLDMGAEKHMFVWIIGQSKHYPLTKVSTGEIRELVGSVELARAKVFAGANDPLEDLTVRLCDPIFYMFFTSGTFTRDSKELMTRSGVLAFEGLQLAQFIADHGIGTVEGAFCQSAFHEWLAR